MPSGQACACFLSSVPIVGIFKSLSKEDQNKEVKMESREGKKEEGRKKERKGKKEIKESEQQNPCSISSENCSKMMSYLHTSKYKPLQ